MPGQPDLTELHSLAKELARKSFRLELIQALFVLSLISATGLVGALVASKVQESYGLRSHAPYWFALSIPFSVVLGILYFHRQSEWDAFKARLGARVAASEYGDLERLALDSDPERSALAKVVRGHIAAKEYATLRYLAKCRWLGHSPEQSMALANRYELFLADLGAVKRPQKPEMYWQLRLPFYLMTLASTVLLFLWPFSLTKLNHHLGSLGSSSLVGLWFVACVMAGYFAWPGHRMSLDEKERWGKFVDKWARLLSVQDKILLYRQGYFVLLHMADLRLAFRLVSVNQMQRSHKLRPRDQKLVESVLSQPRLKF